MVIAILVSSGRKSSASLVLLRCLLISFRFGESSVRSISSIALLNYIYTSRIFYGYFSRSV